MSSIAIRREMNDAHEGADVGWDPRRTVCALLSRNPFTEGLPAPGQLSIFVHAFDVEETVGAYELRVDVPGVLEKDLDIAIAGNRLTVCGKRAYPEGRSRPSSERGRRSFTRRLTLPGGADTENVRASLDRGVLLITVPKKRIV
jgi:HSP20 family protein